MSSLGALSHPLQEQSFVAFDTETTGIWAPAHRIVEIAAVKFRLGGGPEVSFQTLVNPLRKIPHEVIEIHGITNEMVADAPEAPAALQQFLAFCGTDSILVAHNAIFDISFVACELERAQMIRPPAVILDTIDIFQRLHPELESYSLLSVASALGIAQVQEHRALADAELVRQLMLHAAPKLPPMSTAEELSRHFTVFSFDHWQENEVELPAEFAALQTAIVAGKRVRLEYRTPSQDPSIRIIQPRQVYGLGSRVYIYGFCERSHEDRTFRLDRIITFEVLDD